MKIKNIGLQVNPPMKACEDDKCPFHGKLSVHGRVMEGNVVSTRAQKTAIIEMQYQQFLPKYQRFERRHSRISAYNPECVGAKEGNRVLIAECRPLSKTKSFVVVEVRE